jgi:uncharacterized protein YndB with AHSA1/START domain
VPDVPRFTDTVTSPAAREVVFLYLADFSSVAEWDPSVTEAQALEPGGPGPGQRFRVVVKALGRETPYEYETVDYEPSERVVVRAETSSVVSLDTITFADAPGGGTQVTYDARLDLKGAYRLAAPLMAIGFRRLAGAAKAGLQRQLARVGAGGPE